MRILIIEDEKEIADFLKANLEKESFVVDNAIDGEKGSFMARTNDYDLIILDYVLPEKDGLQVCKEIRAKGKAMPILVLSVKTETITKVDILNAGADDYLTKPYSFEELMARIKSLLRRPKKIASEVITIDDLVLDTNKYLAKRGKKEIYLTRKEFMLLEYLMRNQGIVLTRGMILSHVWDESADPFSNTIEAHILNLRRKIELPKKKKLIHTVPNRGYKID